MPRESVSKPLLEKQRSFALLGACKSHLYCFFCFLLKKRDTKHPSKSQSKGFIYAL